MERLIKDARTRRLYLLLVLVSMGFILLTRHYLVPYFSGEDIESGVDIFTSILDEIFVSLLVSTFAALTVFFLYKSTDEQDFQIIQPRSIGREIEALRSDTDIYYFKGGSGRFTRVITIPDLAKRARDTSSHKSLKLLILDPANTNLCKVYADHRRGLKSGKGQDFWNHFNVKSQLIATLVTAAYWELKEPLLDISVGLCNSYSVSRIDMSSDAVVITKEDPRSHAMKFGKSSDFFATYRDEIYQLMRQIKMLNMSSLKVDTPSAISHGFIRSVMSHFGVDGVGNSKLVSNVYKYCEQHDSGWSKIKS